MGSGVGRGVRGPGLVERSVGFRVGREGRGVRGQCRGAWAPGSVERGVGSGVGAEGHGVWGR